MLHGWQNEDSGIIVRCHFNFLLSGRLMHTPILCLGMMGGRYEKLQRSYDAVVVQHDAAQQELDRQRKHGSAPVQDEIAHYQRTLFTPSTMV